MEFLAPAVASGQFTMWVDRQMTGGAVWEKEIEDKLRACDIFVLLVSPKSMASTFIIEKEIKIARERQAAGDPLHVFPLLLRPTPDAGLDRVREFNLRPRDAKPFSAYPLHDREQRMSDAANEIADIAKLVAERKAAAARTVELRHLVENAGLRPSHGPFSISTACPKPAMSGWSGATRS